MAELSYDINQILEEAIGVRASFALSGAPRPNPPLIYTDVGVADVQQDLVGEEIDEENATSYLGTPVLFPIVFDGGTYQAYDDNGEIIEVDLDRFPLPYTAVANFSRGKRVSETPINGNNGAVIETSGFESWQIDISGVILDENPKRFPEDKFRQLMAFEEVVDAIPVEGKMFEYLSIYQLFIKSIRTPKIKKFPYVQPFEISAVSTQPAELILEL